MRFGSFCSGIGSPECAWTGLGWTPCFHSEIEPFPCEVLAQRFPGVPNLGDMTKIDHEEIKRRFFGIDVLVAGTPCQSFSIAGLRKGMDDPRGNLALVFLGLVDAIRPRWLVWENVPGVHSSWTDEAAHFASEKSHRDIREAVEDCRRLGIDVGPDFGPGEFEEVDQSNDFDCFLGALGELGYGFATRILDAQYGGVPQRRRRVFVVGCLGGWNRAAAVLLERESLLGNSPPRREAGKRIAECLTRGADSSGAGGYAGRRREDDQNLVAGCINSGGNNGGFRTEPGEHLVARALNCMSGIQDGGDDTHLVACSLCAHTGIHEKAQTLIVHPVAIQEDNQNGVTVRDTTGSLRSDAPGSQPCGTLIGDPVGYNVQATFSEGRGPHASQSESTKCLDSHGLNPDCQQGGTIVKTNMIGKGVQGSMAVRRLTPL